MNKTASLPSVSIVIPTLNEEHYLPMLLESLRPIESPIEILVVDGKSDDATKEVVERYAASAAHQRVIFLPSAKRNTGAQRNMGAQAAQYSLLLFLDADVIVPSSHTLSELIAEFLERDLTAGNAKLVAHPQEATLATRTLFAFARIYQHFMLLIGKPLFAGACILTRRDVFLHIGGFDESMTLSEDTDYARRILLHGRCGLLCASVSTSMRRLSTMSGSQAWEFFKALPIYLITGKAPDRLVKYYTFGNF